MFLEMFGSAEVTGAAGSQMWDSRRMKQGQELSFDDDGRPVLITRAAPAYEEQHRARVRRYLTIMSFRVPALLLAALAVSSLSLAAPPAAPPAGEYLTEQGWGVLTLKPASAATCSPATRPSCCPSPRGG